MKIRTLDDLILHLDVIDQNNPEELKEELEEDPFFGGTPSGGQDDHYVIIRSIEDINKNILRVSQDGGNSNIEEMEFQIGQINSLIENLYPRIEGYRNSRR